jgi:hypothetical protein
LKITRCSLAAVAAILAARAAIAQDPARPPQERIRFGGLQWDKKDSADLRVGSGPNWFSARNVALDSAGRLHLRVEARDGGCVAAEVVASPSLGYGTYRFTLDSNIDDLAKNLVLGLFVWDDTSAISFHREMDIEIGRWNQEDHANAQFVIQPDTIPGNLMRFRLPSGLRRSIHTFTWAPDRVSFRSEGILPNGEKRPIEEHIFQRMIPEPAREQTRINLWCANAKAPDGGTTEVVVGGFEFTPLR